MGSTRPDRRGFLKGGAALAGGLTLGATEPAFGQLPNPDTYIKGTDDLVVVDIRTGNLLDRVHTGSRIANGMFLTPGGNRDVFYCTTLTVARVVWR